MTDELMRYHLVCLADGVAVCRRNGTLRDLLSRRHHLQADDRPTDILRRCDCDDLQVPSTSHLCTYSSTYGIARRLGM